jgi:hypothetical protein
MAWLWTCRTDPRTVGQVCESCSSQKLDSRHRCQYLTISGVIFHVYDLKLMLVSIYISLQEDFLGNDLGDETYQINTWNELATADFRSVG